jgi:hypothetical protein
LKLILYIRQKKNRRVKAAIKLYERNDANIQEFDKDELLPMLLQNDCHSIEQSDSEDESRQKLPDNKRFLHVYDREWRSNKVLKLLLLTYFNIYSIYKVYLCF